MQNIFELYLVKVVYINQPAKQHYFLLINLIKFQHKDKYIKKKKSLLDNNSYRVNCN